MDSKELKHLEGDLEDIMSRYGIKNAAFAGRHEEDYIGMFVGPQTNADAMETVYNIGRLWQHAREQVRTMLNRFEKDRWNQ